MKNNYTQGRMFGSSVVLQNGIPMILEEIIDKLNLLEELRIETDSLMKDARSLKALERVEGK